MLGDTLHGIITLVLEIAGSVSPSLLLVLLIYTLFGERFGIDALMLLIVVGFGWALLKMLRYVYLFMESIIEHHFMCLINMTEDD